MTTLMGAVLSFAQVGHASIRMPSVIGDNMVLQSGADIPIWGWEEPGQRIVVALDGHQQPTTADPDGRWMVRMNPPAVGGPYEMSIRGRDELILENILVGEVWVASGQSNMEFGLELALNAQEELASARNSNIRLFKVERSYADTPQPDCSGTWAECVPESAYGFSAIGYAFGTALQRELGVPVGIVHAAWGGTWAEAWMGRTALEQDPHVQEILDRYERREICEFFTPDSLNFPNAVKGYDEAVAAWVREAQKARADGTTIPPEPRKPYDPQLRNAPSCLFNGMVAPLIPYGIRGVVWSQGEWNARRGYRYRDVFPRLITNWRDEWGLGNFPFYFAQLGPYDGYEVPESAAELRESQAQALSLPNTGMVVTLDVGDPRDIHPRDKQTVGERLARWALAKDYGRDIVYSGPLYKSASVEGNRIRVAFDHASGGLVAQGGPLTDFAVAAEDRRFVAADAVIDGETVLVSAKSVATPVAVRFGWTNAAEPNLFNAEGLPASPFRTDDWPCVTQDEL